MNTHVSIRWVVTVAVLVSGMVTAGCGSGTTATDTPADPPAVGRIYPPTDVPEMRRPIYTPPAAATEGFGQHQEEELRGPGGRAVMP